MQVQSITNLGRGTEINPINPFLKSVRTNFDTDGIDIFESSSERTQFLKDYPKKIINKVNSPDLQMSYSVNPYQGCEHGCAYCYARNTHFYNGYSSGKDFEQKIVVKQNAPELLLSEISSKHWKGEPISFSGNTDCYQPAEKKFELTRRMLEIMLQYRHPMNIITKNSLVLRDLDILKKLAHRDLVHVYISITTLDERLRRRLEPRTASVKKKLETIKVLSNAGIPVGVMVAPIIPGLNDHEIPEIIKSVSEAGARQAGYTVLRLNGSLPEIFSDWLEQHYPDRKNKILNLVKSCHDGKLSDSTFHRRIKGTGAIAAHIAQLFQLSKNTYLQGKSMPEYNKSIFIKPKKNQLMLF